MPACQQLEEGFAHWNARRTSDTWEVHLAHGAVHAWYVFVSAACVFQLIWSQSKAVAAVARCAVQCLMCSCNSYCTGCLWSQTCSLHTSYVAFEDQPRTCSRAGPPIIGSMYALSSALLRWQAHPKCVTPDTVSSSQARMLQQ